jgi:hypothetical protein
MKYITFLLFIFFLFVSCYPILNLKKSSFGKQYLNKGHKVYKTYGIAVFSYAPNDFTFITKKKYKPLNQGVKFGDTGDSLFYFGSGITSAAMADIRDNCLKTIVISGVDCRICNLYIEYYSLPEMDPRKYMSKNFYDKTYSIPFKYETSDNKKVNLYLKYIPEPVILKYKILP